MGRRFLVQHGADVLHLSRKLFANGFLFGMGLVCFNSIGNYLRMISCPAWGIVLQLNRKLFADSFLSGMGTLCLNSIGNYLRMVFCSAWG